ncbi:MAG TPA: putative sulfate exporter family transporter [Gemmatales bacterium]|nr:putative sulfate exporter family transporter [Gemmatales bacterium]HMP57976.1 putative sulfate exporter family transporter [Gemmatales bacterium]
MRVWLSWGPGYLLLAVLAAVALAISSLIVVGGKEPVEASALVVVLGILLRNFGRVPAVCLPGIRAAEKLLVLGIVLMGFGLDYHKVLGEGRELLTIILVTMTVGGGVTFLFGRLAQLSREFSLLLAAGTCICGGTAVAIIAPLIKAKEEETSYTIAVIALWGVAAILLYPTLARLPILEETLGVTDNRFGVFAGTAIHSTPQVVGAGYVYSESAGKTATAVKLVRNCFIAPVALLIALAYARRQAGAEGVKVNYAKAFPWFLFAYFLTSWLGTEGYVAADYVKRLEQAGKLLIILGMAGVGLGTDLSALRRVGLRPFFVGLAGALAVAAASIGLIAAVLT